MAKTEIAQEVEKILSKRGKLNFQYEEYQFVDNFELEIILGKSNEFLGIVTVEKRDPQITLTLSETVPKEYLGTIKRTLRELAGDLESLSTKERKVIVKFKF